MQHFFVFHLKIVTIEQIEQLKKEMGKMAEEIKIDFEAKKPSGIKLLTRLYDGHLVLNDIGVRLDDQLSNGEEITVPTNDDLQNISETFKKMVDVFTEITEEFSDVDNFIENFGGETKDFAEKLIVEMNEFNDGISEIGSTEGGLASYDDDKLNDWVNKMMGDIVETNETFSKLTK